MNARQICELSQTESIKMYFKFSFVSCLVILAIVSATQTVERKDFRIESLDSVQNLRFEKIGKLKLIIETRLLHFNFNLTSIVDVIETQFITKLEVLRGLCPLIGENCDENMNTLSEELRKMIKVLQDMLNGLKQKNISRLKRDIVGFDESMFVNKIQIVLDNIKRQLSFYDDRSKLLEVNNAIIINSSQIEHNRTSRIEGLLLINEYQSNINNLKEKFKVIYRVMQNKRMDNELIDISTFEDKLQDIKSKLKGTDKQLPFTIPVEYFNKLEVRHRFHETVLVFEMNIPIVDKSKRTLFKLLNVPIRVGNKLVVLDTQELFLANDSKESIVTFKSLDHCFKEGQDENPTFLCELQSPIFQINSVDNCLAKSFRQGNIDLKICLIRVVEFQQLTFIKFGDGTFFYYSNRSDTLEINCNGNVENVTLIKYIGLLTMESGCSANISKNVKLMVIDRVKESPIWNHNFLNITFDLDKLKTMVQRISAPSDSHTQLYENVNELNKVLALAKDPKDLNTNIGTDRSEIMLWMLPLLFILLTVLCLMRCLRFLLGK